MASKETFKDFYSYTNSNWFKTFSLPDEYSRYSTFNIVLSGIEQKLLHILNNLNFKSNQELDNEQKLIVILFRKITDTDTRNNLGINPLIPLFDLIDSINSTNLSKTLGILSLLDLNPLISIHPSQDLKNKDTYILNITEPNCVLPSKEYYTDPSYSNIIDKYIDFIAKVLEIIIPPGSYPALPKLNYSLGQKIFYFEKKISQSILPNVMRRDVDNVYNIMEYSEIKKILSQGLGLLDLDKMLEPLVELKPDLYDYIGKINSYNLDYFNVLNELIEDIDMTKLYLKYFIFIKMGNYLSEKTEELCFDFFDKTIGGVQIQKSIEIKAIDILGGLVGELIGKEYIQSYYNPDTTQYVCDMIDKIKGASCDIIKSCKWMGSKTKSKAIEKINSMNVLVGHSKVFKDYSSLDPNLLNNLDLIGVLNSFSVFYSIFYLNKLGSTPDPLEWHMNCYDVNAYYNPIMNQIVFPAGILQKPFFSLDSTFEENLGGIGSVIGHEISHGFDDQGRKFNSKGQLAQWWTDSDISEYDKRVQPIIKQFDSIKLLGYNISGKLTLGENIADYTAVTICVKVLENSNGKTHQYKLLFKSYANIWKQKIRQEELIKRLQTDPHAPGRFRTNQILSNIPKFIEVFSIDPSHPMFIHENQRVKLWN